MAKAKTQYVCNECGSAFAKWAGQCTDCGAWNSLTEFNPDRGMGPRAGKGAKTGWAGEARTVTTMAEVALVEEPRVPSGSSELVLRPWRSVDWSCRPVATWTRRR